MKKILPLMLALLLPNICQALLTLNIPLNVPSTLAVGSSIDIGTFNAPVTASTNTLPGCTFAIGPNKVTVTGVKAGAPCAIIGALHTTYSITIVPPKQDQTITVGPVPASVSVGSITPVSATSTSKLTVSFSSKTSSVCTVAANKVTAIAEGSCTIAADQLGNANYNAAPQVLETFASNKSDQTIKLSAVISPPYTVFYTKWYADLKAPSSSPKAGFSTFATTTPSICHIVNDNDGTNKPYGGKAQVFSDTEGTCIVTADNAANTFVNAAPQVSLSLPIVRQTQTVKFIPPLPVMTVFGTGQINAYSSRPYLQWQTTYTSLTTDVCTVVANTIDKTNPNNPANGKATVTALTTGSCIIQASQAGDASTAPAAPVTATLPIGKANQTLTWGTAPTLALNGTAQVSATSSASLPIVYTSTTPTVCTISSNTVTAKTAGSCIVQAAQAGNDTYNPATKVNQTIVVPKSSQTITFNNLNSIKAGTTQALTATSSSSLPITFSSATPAICTVSPTTVNAKAAGTCTVNANQVGNVSYLPAAQVQKQFTVTAK